MDKPWMLDELAHAGPEHLDPAFVVGFDRKQGYPDPGEDVATLRAHGLDASSTVVDLGAGTGRFALAAASEFGKVIAADVSPAMVAWLRREADTAGLTNLHCVPAGFLSYEHAGTPADAVYTRHALHQLPDFWKAVALDRIARLLRPGGVLRLRDLIYDFLPGDANDVFTRWLDTAADDPTAGYTADEDTTTFCRMTGQEFLAAVERPSIGTPYLVRSGRCPGSEAPTVLVGPPGASPYPDAGTQAAVTSGDFLVTVRGTVTGP